MSKRFIYSVILLLSGLSGFLLSWMIHYHSSKTPTVQLIQTYHYPATFVKQLQGDPQAGKKIFQAFCTTCHGKQPQIDIHAPRIGDALAWKNQRRLGMPALLMLTIHGVGAMPARGGCFECSDEQLKATIQYILNQ